MRWGWQRKAEVVARLSRSRSKPALGQQEQAQHSPYRLTGLLTRFSAGRKRHPEDLPPPKTDALPLCLPSQSFAGGEQLEAQPR